MILDLDAPGHEVRVRPGGQLPNLVHILQCDDEAVARRSGIDRADPRSLAITAHCRDRLDQRQVPGIQHSQRSEEHTSELQSLMRISYAVFCLKKKKRHKTNNR